MPIANIHSQVCAELEDNILPFWQKFSCDNVFGGYIGSMDLAGVIDSKADKSAIFTARILWTFSAAYQQQKNFKDLEQAQRAYRFFRENFFDNEYQGVYQTLAYDNSVLNDEKNIVAQAYAIYGLSAYFKASKDVSALDKAYEIAKLIEINAFDKKSGSYAMACNRQWQVDNENELYRYAQVHLHLIEAYSELLSCEYNPIIATSLTAIIELFIEYMIDKDQLHVGQKYSLDWQLVSDQKIYGHDLEAAWLLVHAAEKLNNDILVDKCTKLALKVIDKVIFAHEDTTIDGQQNYNAGFKLGLNFTENINNNREGWIQAEAISALSWAYKTTGDDIYRHWLIGTWQYINKEIKDHQNGDWYSGRRDDGSLVSGQLKIGPWKCPYHSVRACIKLIHLLDDPISKIA